MLLLGAITGAVIASYALPPALSWYTSPGGLPDGAQIQAVVQIPEVMRYANTRLIRGQLIGAVIGAVVGLALRIGFSLRGPRSRGRVDVRSY